MMTVLCVKKGMRKITQLIGFMLLPMLANAQAPTFDWAKSITGNAVKEIYDVTTDFEGNVYTTGTLGLSANIGPGEGTLEAVVNPFNPNANMGRNVFVTKMTSAGTLVWAKTFGGEYDDIAKAIKTDASGNIYVAGTFKGQCDFNPNPGEFYLNSGSVLSNFGDNSFIMKMGPTGNLLWAKAFVGTYNQELNDIDVDAQGNVYSTGTFIGLNSFAVDFDPGFGTNFVPATTYDVFISKITTDGDFVWVKTFSGGDSDSVNVEDRDKGNSLKLDSQGNVVVLGSFRLTNDFDPSTGVNNLTAAGSYDNSDLFVAKLDNSGNLIWAKRIGGQAEDRGKSLGIDANNNIYTFGYHSSDSEFPEVDFDPNAGVFNLLPSTRFKNVVTKLTSTGNFEWAKLFRGNNTGDYYFGRSFDVDSNGNFYVCENFSGTINNPLIADFDDGVGVFNLTATSESIFLVKYNTSGSFITAYKIGNNSSGINSYGIHAGANGSIYNIGQYDGTIDFDPTDGVFNLLSTTYNCYLQKVSNQSLGIQENKYKNLSIYPNPTRDFINFEMNNMVDTVSVKVISMQGQVVKEQSLSKNNATIDVSALSKGLYIVEILSGNEVTRTKFIKN
jgi:hypothetical protein